MRWSIAAALALVISLLMAVPALAAESFVMDCPNCDHIDAAGKGLDPNATLIVNIKDLKTGEHVIPESTTVKTDANGDFNAEYDVDLADHPATEGSVFNSDGGNLVLAAHTQFNAPPHCARGASLPNTGYDATRALAVFGTALVGGGVLLLTLSRVRARRISG